MKKTKLIKYPLVLIIFIILGFAGYEYFTPEGSISQPLNITIIDVGQGDAILVQSDNKNMLIDAGPNSSSLNLVNSLTKMKINRFEVVVATHPHEDHIGGLDSVINKFDIDQVIMPQVSANTQTFNDVLQAIHNKGLTVTAPVPENNFTLGSALCAILAPNIPSYEDINSYSIVMRVVYGNITFLFMGDAGLDSETDIISKGYSLNSDVIKIGHHGSSSSTSDELIKAVNPRYAVISSGQDNDYGHPHKETISKLNSAGVIIYRTDLNGDVTFSSNGTNLVVKTER
jgi:competence protein ComEC